MAFTERISKTHYIPQDFNEQIDIRRTRLPSRRVSDGGFLPYNPLDHREPLKPIKLWMAYLNLLRSLFGPGMLIIPFAISLVGYVLGPILTFLSGLILVHTNLMLLNCLNEVGRRLRIPFVSYRYGFRLAVLHGPKFFHCIGNNGPPIVATFMILNQLGICIVYITMTTDCLRDLLDYETNTQALGTMILPYLVLELFMTSVRIAGVVSFIATVLHLIGLIMTFCVIFIFPKDNPEIEPATSDGLLVLYCFAICLFNLSAGGVIIATDKSLKEARKMSTRFGVIRVGLLTPTVVSMIFGACGYWAFGTMEDNILRVLPLTEVTSVVVLSIYITSVALSFPLQCEPAIAMITEVIKYHDPLSVPEEKTLKLIENIGRPIFVMFSFLIAYLVPYQGPFVAFVGSVCTSMLSLVFPALMNLSLRNPEFKSPCDLILIKDILIILFGIIIWCFGAGFCSYIIYIRILSYQSPNNNQYI